MKSRLRIPLLVALPMLVIDQITKFLVLDLIPYHTEIVIIPKFFSLVHIRNTGAAFGMFSNNNGFFIGLAIVAIIVVTVAILRAGFSGKLLSTAAGLLLGGILGNLTDRIIHGNVIDFLSFQFGNYTWPAFNIADSCICIAAGLMIYHSLLPEHSNKAKSNS